MRNHVLGERKQKNSWRLPAREVLLTSEILSRDRERNRGGRRLLGEGHRHWVSSFSATTLWLGVAYKKDVFSRKAPGRRGVCRRLNFWDNFGVGEGKEKTGCGRTRGRERQKAATPCSRAPQRNLPRYRYSNLQERIWTRSEE